ncbi:hypothetical protein HMN09_00981700 [Mycena chlorophos]|uniref:F-box domain-containing protein n=1 Tax=Mycena chlorophos TaxID=658473 RepID=A0A8H6SHL8_MYCCL|nr:hypothetical protein HMN09_00981700 [Mycena chlorophos]
MSGAALFSFASQLDTNYCPTDNELEQIKSFLVEARARLARIDQERDALAGEIAAYEALISPIRRIPDDVLEEIFSACLPPDRNCAMSASDAPLLLSRVCGRWRNVAFRTPSLWSRLHIAQPAVRGWLPMLSKDEAWENMISSKVAQRLAAARQWLERSGDCPLTISFVAAEGSDPHAQAAFFQLLVDYIRRWRAISLKFQLLAGSELREHFNQLQRESAPLLAKFSLDVMGSSTMGEPMNWSTLMLLDGASLTHIDLSYCGPGILSIPIQWHRLTSMSFSENPANVTSEDLAQLFSRTTSLQSLELSFNGTPPPLQTVQAIVSPVQKLWLSEPYNFMAQLVTSELTLLDIQLVREADAGLQTLLHVLSCSKKLETLRIISALGLDPLKQLFSALPTSLRELDVVERGRRSFPLGPRIDDSLLSILNVEGALPRLERMSLALDCDGHFSEDRIVEFLQGRIQAGLERHHSPPLFRRFQLTYARLPAFSTIVDAQSNRLRQFSEVGIDISLQYPPLPSLSPFPAMKVRSVPWW